MDFYIYVENLFVLEGIKSILNSKYPDSGVFTIEQFEQFKPQHAKKEVVFITNHAPVFNTYQPKISRMLQKHPFKTIYIANSFQIEALKQKDLALIDALIHTNCSLQDLNEALGYIQAGMKYRCKKLPQHSGKIDAFNALLNEKQVSGREREIIFLVLEGYTSMEIADSLNISYNTVTTHRKNYNRKLDIKTPQDLMRLALNI